MNSTFSAVQLVELFGFGLGLVLNGLLVTMVVRWHNGPRLRSGTGLAFPAATLGLVYNFASLGAMVLNLEGRPSASLETAAGIALGFLPALVVQTAVGRATSAGWSPGRILVTAGYVLSSAAGAAHLEAWRSGGSSAVAFEWLAYGFGAIGLLIPSAQAAAASGVRNLVWSLALLVFCFSAIHLAPGTHLDDSLLRSLLGHQASIPLALAILIQDFRFAFVDLFLKKALTAVLVGGTGAVVLVAAFPGHWSDREQRWPGLALDLLFVVACVSLALVAPTFQRGVSAFVDRYLLKRTDPRAVLSRAELAIAEAISEAEVLRAAEAEVARAFGNAGTTDERAHQDPAIEVSVRTHDAPAYVLRVGPLPGGRRWYSEDHSLLEQLAALAARRIDGLRLHHERCSRDLREEEARRLASEAELTALRAQLNPHFLFNALTTLSYWIRRSPERAEEHLQSLTLLLRAVLRRTESELVTLGQELELIEAYLQIEKARFESRLEISIAAPAAVRSIRLPALTLQPLVENAVKHGVSKRRDGGAIRIAAEFMPDGSSVSITISDTGAGSSADQLAHGRRRGIGLVSIEKRLRAAFGDDAALSFSSTPGLGSTAIVRIPATAVRLDAHPVAVAS